MVDGVVRGRGVDSKRWRAVRPVENVAAVQRTANKPAVAVEQYALPPPEVVVLQCERRTLPPPTEPCKQLVEMGGDVAVPP